MFSPVTIGTNDVACARRLYAPVMATLGLSEPFAMQWGSDDDYGLSTA